MQIPAKWKFCCEFAKRLLDWHRMEGLGGHWEWAGFENLGCLTFSGITENSHDKDRQTWWDPVKNKQNYYLVETGEMPRQITCGIRKGGGCWVSLLGAQENNGWAVKVMT